MRYIMAPKLKVSSVKLGLKVIFKAILNKSIFHAYDLAVNFDLKRRTLLRIRKVQFYL